jgi:hypothetical protein
MGGNSFAFNSLTIRNFQFSFVHSSRKIRASVSKHKGREREKLILFARFLLNADWTKLEENSFASYSFTVWNFLKSFHKYKFSL